jgi:hypothetical protein
VLVKARFFIFFTTVGKSSVNQSQARMNFGSKLIFMIRCGGAGGCVPVRWCPKYEASVSSVVYSVYIRKVSKC